MSTKENILNTALTLFARDGYEAVSVSDIAGAIGLTKSALYKHYKNKRDIFDSIVKRMYEYDYENAKKFDVPEDVFENMPEEEEEEPLYTVEQIKQAMEKLPEGYRVVLSLYLFEGYDMEEIAQILHVKPASVRSQYLRGKRKLIEGIKRQ